MALPGAPRLALTRLQFLAAFAMASGALLLLVPALDLLREPALGWLALLLGTTVQVVSGWPFYLGLREAVRQRSPNVDALVVIATSAAWLFGAIEVLAPDALVPGRQQYYFEVAALVLGFLLIGRSFEQRLRRRASVRGLLELQPPRARILKDGNESEVSAASVPAGALVIVSPGERVPVDGLVAEGHAAVDESMITGESLPVDKAPGDRVLCGSVNRGPSLRVTATHAGRETALARIVELVERAQAAPSVGAADRAAARLVPLAVAVGAAAFLAWWQWQGRPLAEAFGVLVSVLLVACPSALTLASPAALAIGVSRGAVGGIVLRGAEALERMPRVDLVVYDKTGTLTRGHPALTDVRALSGSEADLLALAAAVEEGSPHPLAHSIVEYARARHAAAPPAEGVLVLPGAGVEATVEGEDILVGSLRLFRERRIDIEHARATVEKLQDEGKTVILVAREGKLMGVLALSDPVRAEAAEAVARLRAMGVDVALVTGDNARTAGAVARDLGIKRIFAEITPLGKAAAVKGLQEGGHVVAMVGDGINDAPALAQADVGIAIGSGAEIAIETAHVVLVRNDPRDVPEALAVGRRTYAALRENLLWATVYNLALLPVAALGLLTPILAGLANALGSGTVVANAWRTSRRWLPAPADNPKRTPVR